MGESKKAAQAASTFLILLPDHEDMAANLEYYTQVSSPCNLLSPKFKSTVHNTQINACIFQVDGVTGVWLSPR